MPAPPPTSPPKQPVRIRLRTESSAAPGRDLESEGRRIAAAVVVAATDEDAGLELAYGQLRLVARREGSLELAYSVTPQLVEELIRDAASATSALIGAGVILRAVWTALRRLRKGQVDKTRVERLTEDVKHEWEVSFPGGTERLVIRRRAKYRRAK